MSGSGHVHGDLDRDLDQQSNIDGEYDELNDVDLDLDFHQHQDRHINAYGNGHGHRHRDDLTYRECHLHDIVGSGERREYLFREVQPAAFLNDGVRLPHRSDVRRERGSGMLSAELGGERRLPVRRWIDQYHRLVYPREIGQSV